jgi:PhoH-like ATPase
MIYYAEESDNLNALNLVENDCVVLNDLGGKKHLYRYVNEELNLVPFFNKKITGLNEEHHFFMDMFYDKSIKIINVFGAAGSGKSYCSVGCGLESLDDRKFKKIVVIRELVPATRYRAGLLPGSYHEKIEPAFDAIKDTFISLAKRSDVLHNEPILVFDRMIQSETLEICTLEYFRGRSIEDALLIMDDAQNLSVDDIRLIVTRMGEGTMAVFNGDLSQIDHKDKGQPGVLYLDKVMKGSPMYGELTFTHSEYRSAVVKEFLTREQMLKEKS